MIDRSDAARLMQWDAEEQIPAALYDRFTNHAQFREAVHALSVGMLAAAQEDKSLDGIAKDAGRSVVAQWAVYLNLTGGLTLPRLKEICAASGLLSPGRARAVLLYLRYLGYVETIAEREAGKPARYAPTAQLQRTWDRVASIRLKAASIVEPAASSILERFGEREVMDRFHLHHGSGLLRAATAVNQETPFMRIFMHRHAGMQAIHWMLLAARDGDTFPPSGPIPFSGAAIARQLRVSRTHIKRLVNEASRAKFVEMRSDGAIVFTETMRSFVQFVLATILIGQLICAARTARDLLAQQPMLARAVGA